MISSLDAPWAERQAYTLVAKSEDGQKQAVSVLEEHPSVKSQVFKH
jgi:hypothetical protein